MSGYPHKHNILQTDDSEPESELESEVPFISKPFSPEVFAKVVREVLDDSYTS